MPTQTEIHRPALRYHGGKWKLAPWIIEHFPPHKVYVEAFGGAASVLLRKPRSHAEVYNDLAHNVVNVFEVLRDRDSAAELERQLRLTPFARVDFMAIDRESLAAVTDPIERARLTIFRSFAGFGSASTNGQYSTGFRSNSNRSGTTPAHDWVNYPDLIPHLTDRLQGVVIESRDALKVIADQDSPATLHYVDPPYVQSTRTMKSGQHAYEFELSEKDHIELAAALHTVQGMVVLSGYRCELYDDLFGDWERRDRATFADGANPRTESLWLNRTAAAATPQPSLFNTST